MIIAPDPIFYALVLVAGLLYHLYHLHKFKCRPGLTSLFIAITGAAAFIKGIELILNILLNQSLQFGDFRDSKLVLILGGLSVTWVAAISLVDLLQKNPDKD